MDVAQLVVGGIISAIIAGIPTLLILGPNRRKTTNEATNVQANTAERLVGAAAAQMTSAISRADSADARSQRCMDRLQQLEDHIEALERLLRAAHLEVPPWPAPLPWPTQKPT